MIEQPKALGSDHSLPAILTFCAKNYIAQVKVLVASVRALHPGIHVRVVVVDERDEAFAAEHADLDLMWAEELDVPDFPQCSVRFDVFELSTNIKAHALLEQLRTHDRVIYLDSDTCLYASLDPVFEALRVSPILLTPASMTPILDGHRPDDLEFLRVGAFNLGFVGVNSSPQAQEFLRWWSQRCLTEGFHETPSGVFLDQKWIDLVPCYFPDARILRDPGLNVASWNLHERHLALTKDGWLVNGHAPLRFFHFSSFDPHEPRRIARRQTRFLAGARPEMDELLDDYARRLLDAGYDRWSAVEYSFDRFATGEYISPMVRRIYANPAYDFPKEEDPRQRGSALHRFCVAKGWVRPGMQPARRAIAADMQRYSREARIIHMVFRFVLWLIGPNRYFLLMRYLAQAASIRKQPKL